jgi:hypothetical protein
MSASIRELRKVVDDFNRESSQLEDIFISNNNPVIVLGFELPYSPVDDGCVVALWDAWNRFVRELLLACSGSTTLGISGSKYYPTTTRTEDESIHCLCLAAKDRRTRIRSTRGEPHWFDQGAISDMVDALGIANRSQIVSAITSSGISITSGVLITNPIGEIRDIRNFIAHKNAVTLRGIKQHLNSQHNSLSDYLHEIRLGGVPTFGEWVDGLQAIASAAAD